MNELEKTFYESEYMKLNSAMKRAKTIMAEIDKNKLLNQIDYNPEDYE